MSPLLPLLLGLPALGALVLLVGGLSPRATRAVGVAAAAAPLVVAAVVAARFPYHSLPAGSYADVVDVRWLPGIGVRFGLGVDGISLPLVLLTTVLVVLCAVHVAGTSDPRAGRLLGLVLVLEVGALGTFLTLDLLLFFVFFEVVLIPMYLLIALWGNGPRRTGAANTFVLYTLLGSGLMLVGFLLISHAAGTTDIRALGLAHGAGLSHRTQVVAMVLLVLGFGIKSPIWPLHTWLPDAHTEAPTVGSVLLAGVLLKLGTYGLVRVGLEELPAGARALAPAIGVLAVAGIVAGSLACLVQTDLKRLVAYSSVGHMGFVLLGIATLTPVGVQGALIGNIAHGVVTGLLFFLVGAVKDRYGTSDLAEIGGGVATKLPVVGGLLLLASVASLGLPGLAGFWGEMLSLLGAYDPAGALDRPLFVVLLGVGALGTVLTALYFLRLLRIMVAGVVPDAWRERPLQDAVVSDLVAWAPLAVLTVAIGVWPRLVLGVGDTVVRGMLR